MKKATKSVVSILMAFMILSAIGVFASTNEIPDCMQNLIQSLEQQGRNIIVSHGTENPSYLMATTQGIPTKPPSSSKVFLPSNSATVNYSFTSSVRKLYSDFVFVPETSTTPINLACTTGTNPDNEFVVKLYDFTNQSTPVWQRTIHAYEGDVTTLQISFIYLTLGHAYFFEVTPVASGSSFLATVVY